MLLTRIGAFVATLARNAVPIGGVFGRDWHPVTALGVYWLESVLMVFAAANLGALLARRASRANVLAALEDGDEAAARAIQSEHDRFEAAHIKPRPVLYFHLGSLAFVGVFLSGLLVIMVSNQKIEPVRWSELREGATVMATVVTMGWVFDLLMFNRLSVTDVAARVEGCTTRFALFMLLLFSTWPMMFFDRPGILFGTFAGLKVTFELLSRLERRLGGKRGTNQPRRPEKAAPPTRLPP